MEEGARSAEQLQHDSKAHAAVCTEERKQLTDLTHTLSALESVEVHLPSTSPTLHTAHCDHEL